MPKGRPSVSNRYSPRATHARRPRADGVDRAQEEEENSSGCVTGRLGLARTDKHTVTAFCVDA